MQREFGRRNVWSDVARCASDGARGVSGGVHLVCATSDHTFSSSRWCAARVWVSSGADFGRSGGSFGSLRWSFFRLFDVFFVDF